MIKYVSYMTFVHNKAHNHPVIIYIIIGFQTQYIA